MPLFLLLLGIKALTSLPCQARGGLVSLPLISQAKGSPLVHGLLMFWTEWSLPGFLRKREALDLIIQVEVGGGGMSMMALPCPFLPVFFVTKNSDLSTPSCPSVCSSVVSTLA